MRALATLLVILATGCGQAPEDASSESALRPRCDAYEYVDCEPEGPRGQMICSCVLGASYDCDPTGSNLDSCMGDQRVKCGSDGHWQPDGPLCATGTLCQDGACVVPAPAAAKLLAYDLTTGTNSYYPFDSLVINKIGPFGTNFPFEYSYSTPWSAAAVQYQILAFPPSPDDVNAPGLIASGPLTVQSQDHLQSFSMNFSPWATRDPIDFWFRVVMIEENDAVIAITNAIHITYKTVTSPQLDLTEHPKITALQLQPVKGPDENFRYWLRANSDISVFGTTLYLANHDYYLPPDNKSTWDQLGSAVGAVWDALKDAVDWVAHAYATLKQGIVDAAAWAINKAGIPCDDTCKSVLTYALDTGLAACGLPPSLPDADELINNGEDWVVEQMSEATGLPLDQAAPLVHEAQKQLEHARQYGPDGNSLFHPAEPYQYHSGVLYVTLTNTSTRDLPAGSVTVSDRGPSSWFGAISVPKHFQDVTVGYASIPVGRSVTVPVTLIPTLPYTWFEDQFWSCVTQGLLTGANCSAVKDSAYGFWSSYVKTGTVPFDLTTVPRYTSYTGPLDHGQVTVDLSSAAVIYTNL